MNRRLNSDQWRMAVTLRRMNGSLYCYTQTDLERRSKWNWTNALVSELCVYTVVSWIMWIEAKQRTPDLRWAIFPALISAELVTSRRWLKIDVGLRNAEKVAESALIGERKVHFDDEYWPHCYNSSESRYIRSELSCSSISCQKLIANNKKKKKISGRIKE